MRRLDRRRNVPPARADRARVLPTGQTDRSVQCGQRPTTRHRFILAPQFVHEWVLGLYHQRLYFLARRYFPLPMRPTILPFSMITWPRTAVRIGQPRNVMPS